MWDRGDEEGQGSKTHFNYGLKEAGCVSAEVENLIEVLRDTCVWLPCRSPAQSVVLIGG